MELTIQNQTENKTWNRFRKDFLRILAKTQQLLKVDPNQSLSVIFLQDEAIREINRMYRDKDVATDVISFALQDSEDGIDFSMMEENEELGDIFINVDAVLRQSKDYGHTIRREMCFLFTHGLLHLLGYDHMNDEEEHRMFALQDEILKEIAPKRVRRYE